MDVSHPDRGQHRQIHDPQPAAKITTVDGDDQLKDRGTHDCGG